MPTRKLGPMTIDEGVQALVESHFQDRDWALWAMTAALTFGNFEHHIEDYTLHIEKFLTDDGNVYVFEITPDDEDDDE
jgi:hypothetical protein